MSRELQGKYCRSTLPTTLEAIAKFLGESKKNNFGSFIYGESSTNSANAVKIGPVDVEIICLTEHTHTHARLIAVCPWLPRWVGTRKVKPIWILLKQETVSGSGISWARCKSAPYSRQITMPALHRVFSRPDALPVAQPTASKHWQKLLKNIYRVKK